MKPCAKNQKSLGLLAIDALSSADAQELRSHLRTCVACQSYFKEMSGLAGKLKASDAVIPEIQVSGKFHQELRQRITAERRGNIWETITSLSAGERLKWNFAVPFTALALTIIVAFLFFQTFRKAEIASPVRQPVVLANTPERDTEPTFGNYRILADRSPDVLEKELAREARIADARTPIYKASSLPQSLLTD